MLPAPAYAKATGEGAGQGSRKSAEEERRSFESLASPFPPTTWEGRGAATLPQGSSFGVCKAQLSGDKRAIWKTARKKKTSRRIRQTAGHKIEGARQTSPAFQLQPGTPHIPAVPCGGGQVGTTALGRESGSLQSCRAQSVSPTVPALGKQTRGNAIFTKPLDKLRMVTLKVPMPESSDNSINPSTCAQKRDSSPTHPPVTLDQADWDPSG